MRAPASRDVWTMSLTIAGTKDIPPAPTRVIFGAVMRLLL